jgi:hypothetical protein
MTRLRLLIFLHWKSHRLLQLLIMFITCFYCLVIDEKIPADIEVYLCMIFTINYCYRVCSVAYAEQEPYRLRLQRPGFRRIPAPIAYALMATAQMAYALIATAPASMIHALMAPAPAPMAHAFMTTALSLIFTGYRIF